jgi:nucleoside-diphosphate-sugar epimerase
VLVTGGQGFIGSHVVQRLLAKGYRVVSFDRRFAKVVPEVEFFYGDIRDAKAVEQAVFATDGVIHLAGILGTVETLQHIPETVDVNIVGTINVFEAIKKYKHPCVYITLPDVWKNPYSFTKRTAKDFAFLYNREFGTKINVVRSFNVYGEGQKYKPVRKFAPQWIIGALLGKPLEVYGEGSQLMDLVYVGDVAEILIRALETPKTATEVIDAAPGDAVTVKQVANLMAKLLGAQIVSKPMRQGETSEAVIRGNPETTRRWIGDFQFTPVEEGMERTIRWYKEHYRELL